MSDHPNDSNHDEPEPDEPEHDGPEHDEPEQLDLDTAISAELDGEFAAYATELGRDQSSLRAELITLPGYTDRRAALQSVRDQLREPVMALDDVTRRRLFARAMTREGSAGGTRSTRSPSRSRTTAASRGWSARLAVAAAILFLLLGGGVFLSNRGTDNGQKLSAKSSAGGTVGPVREGNLGDIGDLSNPSTLDHLIGGPGVPKEANPQNSAERALRSSAPSVSSSGGGTSNDASASPVDGFQPDTTAGATPDQVQACAQQYAAQGTVRFTASGVYQGRPAAVLGVVVGKSTIVFVVAATDCDTVLFSVSR